jgi:uncharacterized membrane protein
MNADVRIGDAERERAAAVLGDHYAAGRLEHSEYAERLDAIWSARTRRDLDVLFTDLPRLMPQPPAPAARRGGPPLPVLALLALVVGVLVLAHLPIILLVVGIVLVAKLGRRRSWAGHRQWQRGGSAPRW